MASNKKKKDVVIHSAADDMEIAGQYTVADWKACWTEPEDPWKKAISIFDTRIRSRFIDPVDFLFAHEIGRDRGMFGFAILALDCLLIETLQGFHSGVIDHTGKSKELFRAFLSKRLPEHFDDGGADESKADKFYKKCRCALHHAGQTDGDFRVGRNGPVIEFKDERVTVNRTAFHEELKRQFDAYLTELANPANTDLRKNFKKKMDAICGIRSQETCGESA
ncbi:MAG: hypothetical protein QM599_04230 [Pseudoxanthomonas sp.]